MTDRLPVDYYVLPVDPESVPREILRTIDRAATDHQYWFIENFMATSGEPHPIWHQAADWCEDQFGGSGSRWTCHLSETKFCRFTFSSQEDAFCFKLRWC